MKEIFVKANFVTPSCTKFQYLAARILLDVINAGTAKFHYNTRT